MVMPIRRESLGAALCFCGAGGALLASIPASLASLMQFGGWEGTSRSSHLSAWPVLGEGGQGTIAPVVAEPLSLGCGVPQISHLGCMRTPKKLEKCNPKPGLPGKTPTLPDLGQTAGLGGISPLSHTPKAPRRTSPALSCFFKGLCRAATSSPSSDTPWQPRSPGSSTTVSLLWAGPAEGSQAVNEGHSECRTESIVRAGPALEG